MSFVTRRHRCAHFSGEEPDLYHSDPTLNALDDFALTACQACNFGDKGSWFLCFRLSSGASVIDGGV